MLWITAALAASPEPTTQTELPEITFLIAVFDRMPKIKERDKAVRYALRKAKTLESGRDWGRAMCFRFEGEPEPEVLVRAAAKVGLLAEIREVDNCSEPPKEAFLAAEADHSIIVRTRTPVTPAEVKASVTRLLGVGGLGLIAIRTLDEPRDVFCLEFAERPEDSVLEFALASLPFATVSTEKVEDCKEALIAAN